MDEARQLLKKLPSVDAVLGRPEVRALFEKEGRSAVADAIRILIGRKRTLIIEGSEASSEEVCNVGRREIEDEIAARRTPSLRRVVNATGVVIHTNLGRAPIPSTSLDYLKEIAGAYCNLEYRLEEGGRGSRYDHIEALLCEVTGAEAAHVVNNNAAALLLSATAIAKGREIIVSRGELIEIGDGFRLPEVIAEGGARLVEVGTTNRTRLLDYERAIGEKTAMMLKAHRSNFHMEGFVEDTPIEALVEIGRRHSVPVLFDIGSGALDLPPCLAGSKEPTLRGAILSGADIVAASGDKLLGGPQAGILLGNREWVACMRRHPLTRALRPCKLTLALLHHVLLLYRQGACEMIPVWRMMARSGEELGREARLLGRRIKKLLGPKGWIVEVVPERSKAGGGALPATDLPSWVVKIRHEKIAAGKIEESLRLAKTPVVARLKEGSIVIDVRTLLPGEGDFVVEGLDEIETQRKETKRGAARGPSSHQGG